MKLTIVKVEWLDARSSTGWIDKDDHPKNIPVVTYGIHGGKSGTSLVLYSSYDPQDGNYGDRNLIPLKMIVRVSVLSEEEL